LTLGEIASTDGSLEMAVASSIVRRLKPPAPVWTAHIPAGAADGDQVRAHGRESGFDGRPGAGPDRDHGDHGPDPDDDAQTGEEGPHFVPSQGSERDAQYAEYVHGILLG
jgi:hypothetical protein